MLRFILIWSVSQVDLLKFNYFWTIYAKFSGHQNITEYVAYMPDLEKLLILNYLILYVF